MNTIKEVRHWLGNIKRKIEDWMAIPYLKAVAAKEINRDKIGVAFIVHEPESWDKLQPVYEKMCSDDLFIPKIIVVPSFDVSLSIGTEYGYELEFFEKKYSDTICAIDNEGEIIDLESLHFDYVFYQDPYNAHYPKKLRSNQVVKYSRICYIPYGYTISENFAHLIANNKPFFRNVSIFFSTNKMDGLMFEQMYHSNIRKGIQRIQYLGYPCLERYAKMTRDCSLDRITWTPRWTYDSKVGGSHFIEYKEKFLHLAETYKNIKLLLRPHPMMFNNFIQTGLLTSDEVRDYKNQLTERNIELDINNPIDEILEKTSILLSDISSIIVPYFMTGRPIIYCSCELPLSTEFNKMLDGIYVAKNWDDVNRYIHDLLNGNDYLKNKRIEILQSASFHVHCRSTENIVNYLKFIGQDRI